MFFIRPLLGARFCGQLLAAQAVATGAYTDPLLWGCRYGGGSRSTSIDCHPSQILQMEQQLPHLSSNSTEILERQKRAEALRASGLTIREVAIQLRCSMHVAGTLLARSHDQRIDTGNSAWLNGLPHRTARALLALGFRTKQDVSRALADGTINSDTPGMGPRTVAAINDWLGRGLGLTGTPRGAQGQADGATKRTRLGQPESE